jgi:hypothetical protein
MAEKMVQDASVSTGLKKLLPFLVFRAGNVVERKLGLTAARTTIGRDAGCDLVLDEDGVSGKWGALIRRGEHVFVQHGGGGAVPLEPGEGFIVGPFHIVRADFGTELGRVWKTVEPGTVVQGPSERPLYGTIVVLGDTDVAALAEKSGVAGGDLPARLQTYPAEKRLSDKAADAIEQISRAVARAAADPALAPDADPSLRALEKLSYPELIAVIEELGARKTDGGPELHVFFQRFLLAEPVQAFRFRALLMAKFAAEVRGSGGRAQFPALTVNTALYLSPDVTAKFMEVTSAVAKLVDEGIFV